MSYETTRAIERLEDVVRDIPRRIREESKQPDRMARIESLAREIYPRLVHSNGEVAAEALGLAEHFYDTLDTWRAEEQGLAELRPDRMLSKLSAALNETLRDYGHPGENIADAVSRLMADYRELRAAQGEEPQP
jgi:hypothetical protein